MMLGIKVEKSNENLIISWQLSKIEISINEINDVFFTRTMGERRKAQ